MERRLIAIFSAAILMASCAVKEEPAVVTPETDNYSNPSDSYINADCAIDSHRAPLATKTADEALIDQITTRQLAANFLRITEKHSGSLSKPEGTYFNDVNYIGGGNASDVNWEQAYLCEATVISSPDNTQDINYRSIIFNPQQPYDILSTKISSDPDVFDTTYFYHTRMVGWYPRNCALPSEDDDIDAQFEYAVNNYDQTVYYTDSNTNRKYKAVKFTGLDGSKDIMVSNVCEGQHWHSQDSNNSPHTNDEGNTPYYVPFGHYQKYDKDSDSFSSLYSNFFKFRHYLSGVRFWGFVPEQNTHSLDMWGKINDVVLLNQPTSVCISLPESPKYGSDKNSLSWEDDAKLYSDPEYWGQAFDWGDLQNFSVQTGAMFGDDTNHSDENYTVDFSTIDMTGIGNVDNALYLGYSLVQPDKDVEVQIHTKYGVYVTKIPHNYTYTPTGSDTSASIDIFKAGNYYDIYLSLKTDGTIAALIENRGSEKYYDLTRNVDVSVDGAALGKVTTYRHANTYIVDPGLDTYDTNSDEICDYDGFFFSALTPGNGESGILTYNSQTFYPTSSKLDPVSASLIWESERLLVSDVELINGYVKFKVPGAKTAANYDSDGKYTEEGNAVIGVFDEDGNCLWSWHIWITDTPEDLEYTYGTKTITLMDRNLGATLGGVPSSGDQALETYGLYYQWGRKDPSIGPKTYNYTQSDCVTYHYFDYASDEYNDSNPKSFPSPTLQNAVENPAYLILPSNKLTNGYLYDWCDYGPVNVLWGYNVLTGTMTKTINDPCPFGYRVPSGELEVLMSNAAYSSSYTYGLTFTVDDGNTAFFPFAGYKGVDKQMGSLTAAWKYVSTKGDYQEGYYTRNSSDGIYARKRLYISSAATWSENGTMGLTTYNYGSGKNQEPVNSTNTRVYSDWTNRRTAASVRCVKDTNFGTLTLLNTPAKTTFGADDPVTVSLYAASSAATITDVTATLKYETPDGVQTSEIITRDPKSATWSYEYIFSGREESFLLNTTGVFEIVLEATNEFGISKTESSTLTYENAGTITADPEYYVLRSAGSTTVSALGITTNTTITSYTSSNTDVLEVDSEGNITVKALGSAVITMKADPTDSKSYAIKKTTVYVVNSID